MRAITRLIPHVLAAAALFALPACSLDESGLCTTCSPNLNPGSQPQTTAIVCDIEAMGPAADGSARVCFNNASPFQQTFAVPTTHAALALNGGQTGHFSFSTVPDALNCGSVGEVRTLIGMYPQGTIQCINPGNIGGGSPNPPDANAACVQLCEDLVTDTPSNPPSPTVQTFCQTHARASTNVMALAPQGFANACTNEGSPLASFFNADPRISPENIIWTQMTGGVTGSGVNDLTRNTGGNGTFDQSAVSQQTVPSGDAYVEFSAQETNVPHLIGFSIPPCALPCADTNPGTTDVTFGINLGGDGHYYVVQSGVPVTTGPDVNGSFGTYGPGERFRITVFDLGGGQANVKYSVLTGTCTAGQPCNEHVFFENDGVSGYPLRVDTSFQNGPATLTNVTLMRIITQ